MSYTDVLDYCDSCGKYELERKCENKPGNRAIIITCIVCKYAEILTLSENKKSL